MTTSTPPARPAPIGLEPPAEVSVDASALFSRADGAAANGELRAALQALYEAATFVDAAQIADVVSRTRQLPLKASEDVETGVSILLRAEERFGVNRGLLEARLALHLAAGHFEVAVGVMQRLAPLVDTDVEKAKIWEQMGDLCRDKTAQPQQALIHYQAAFRADRTNRTAVRKAARVYLDLSREEQAKQLLDLEVEQAGGGDALPPEDKKDLADLYLKIGEALLIKPSAHEVAKDAAHRAARLVPDLSRARTLPSEIDAFPNAWKDHVRRLRDAAIDLRDKREAAKRYLSIAEIYAAYAPADAEIGKNVEKCLLLSPGFRPALKFLEQRARDEGKLTEFIEQLKKQAEQVRAVDVAVDMWLFVAMLQAERGAPPDEIAAAYEKVRRIDPRNLTAIHALTELHLEHGNYAGAAVVMEAFLVETSSVDAKRQTLRQLARLYEAELKDTGKACERLEQLRALDPEDDGLLQQLAEIYEKTGEEQKLADVLEQQLKPNKKRTAEHEARVLERLMRAYLGPLAAPDKAMNAGRRLFVLAPRESLEAELTRLADALARGGDLALTFTEAARRLPAGEAHRLRMRAAELFSGAGDRKRARALIDEMLSADPSDRDATAMLDQLLAKDSSPEDHAEVLERRLQTQTEARERARTLGTLGDVYVRLKRFDEAEARLREAFDLDGADRGVAEKLETALRQREKWADVAEVLQRRARAEQDLGNAADAAACLGRLARLYEEKLNRSDDAARIHLDQLERSGDAPDADVIRTLERLQQRGALVVPIAEALQPHYAKVGAWRKHVEMMALRHSAEEDASRRATLAKGMGHILEERLRSAREAFDAWVDALLDEPEDADALKEVERLSQLAQAPARFAEVLLEVAEKLQDGAQKNALLAKRAEMLQGVLGDQVAAIQAHKDVLAKSPGNVSSLDALAKLYAERDAWTDLKDVLEARLAGVSDDDKPAIQCRLGVMIADKIGDVPAALPHLEAALAADKQKAGDERPKALRIVVDSYRRALGAGDESVLEKLSVSLADLGGTLAGKDRSAMRAELGDVHRRLRKFKDALSAYEAALANDPEQTQALEGIRLVLDDPHAGPAERMAASRSLLQRYDAAGNQAGRAHVLGVMFDAEQNPQTRRQLIGQLVHLLTEDLDLPDDAFDRLIKHLALDPIDDAARKQAESLAAALSRTEDLNRVYRELRSHAQSDIARQYAERLADLAISRGDLDGGLEALEFMAQADPKAIEPLERIAQLHERRNDAKGLAAVMEKLAGLLDGAPRLNKLLELADVYFESLGDDVRGLDTLRTCHAMAPRDDSILARLEARLRMQHADTPELASILEKRAALQAAPAQKAGLLLEHGLLLLRLGDVGGAVQSLTESLRVERDGHSTARTAEALRKLAERNDAPGFAALDALLEHHREQKAWQPLVEVLELAAQKREPGEERAQLLDEISRMHEEALRVPQLAFMATCRAFRDVATPERLERARALAESTDSWPDLLEVIEDVAALQTDPASVHALLENAADIAKRINDREGQVRIAEAMLKQEPSNAFALALLEGIHRADADQQALVEVLRRRVATATDIGARRAALMEMAKLLMVADDAGAETALRQVVIDNPRDTDALKALDELHERTGNSAALVDVLRARIANEALAESRVVHRARLGLLLLRRRGDPAGALDELTAAVKDAPHVAEVRQALEALVEHARTRGAPPIGDAAALLEQTLRAQNDLAGVPAVIEMRLSSEPDHATRATLLLEVAQIQERIGQPALGFMTICRAVKELPDDASLRGEAERLAGVTDNLEALALVYEDVLDSVGEQQTRIALHKRIAQIAETSSGDTDTARERLIAAVQAGADDSDTFKDLVRLTRQADDQAALSDSLLRLAAAAAREGKADLAKEAYAELCDVDENLGNLDGAIQAARALLELDTRDAGARATLERLYNRAQKWSELHQLLRWSADEAPTPEQKALVLARLIYVELEQLRDVPAALASLFQLAEASPSAESIPALGTRALLMLSGESRPEAKAWRGQLATLLEPRFEASGAWGELAPVLRLRLDIEADPKERKRLWIRVIDIEERLLDRPEQAMMTIARALGEDPGDTPLRERAERLSVRLHDLESLLGIYEDIIEGLSLGDPMRVTYALRAGELYEGGVGQPARAAEFYDLAYQAATVQRAPDADRQKVLERIERLYRAVGDPKQLAATLKKKADLFSATDANAARAALYEAATIETLGLKDHGAAVMTLQRLLQAHPHDVQALHALGEVCERAGRWPEMAEALERELAALGTSDPARSHAARFKLGVVLDTHIGLPDDALVQFQAILQDAPDHDETRKYLESRIVQRQTGKFDGAIFLTQSYERTGDWQKAVEILNAQVPELEARGDKKELRVHLGKIADIQQQHMNAPDMAFVTLCRAFKADPNDPHQRERLINLAAQAELVDELAEAFEDEAAESEAAGKNALAAELRESAAALYAGPMNDAERAIATYEAVLQKQPGRFVPLEALSKLYGKVGRHADVEKMLRTRLVFKDDPVERVPILVDLAAVLADHLDRPDESLPLLEDARRHDPQNAAARRLLIELNDARGNLEPLRALLEEELDAMRAAGDADGFARTRHRLAVLLADQVQDVAAATPLWEEILKQEPRLMATSASFATLERLYGLAERYGDLKLLYEAAMQVEKEPAVLSTLNAKLGDVLVNLGGREEAVAQHLKMLERDPTNQSSLNALRKLYWDLGKHEELVALIRRMMRSTSHALALKDLRFQLAEVLGQKLNKRAESTETGRRILDIEPHTVAELDRLAVVFRGNEAWEELADVLERAAEIADPAHPEKKVQKLLELATIFEDNLKRKERAAPAYEKILQVDGKNDRAFERLSSLYTAAGNWQKLVVLKDERAKRITDVAARVALLREIGDLYEHKLDSKALAFLAACRAFRENVDDPEAAAWMDRLGVETDSVDELVTIYDDALDGKFNTDARIIDTHLRMAELAWKHMSSPQDAELHYKRALEHDEANKAAIDGLVGLYESQQRWKDAVAVFERRIERSTDPNTRSELLRRVARTLDEKAEDIEGAVDAYQRILQIDERDAAALRDYAELLERHERWQPLINVLKRHEELCETDGERHAIRYRIAGLWEMQLQNPDQAIQTYRSILDEDPAHMQSLRALERLYTVQNKHQDLVKIFEKMVELASSTDDATRLLFKIGATWEEALEEPERAIDANRRALEVDADNLRAIENLERLYRARSSWDDLVAIYERHLKITRDPPEIVQLYISIGDVYGKELGQQDKAEQMYQAALDFDPASQEAIHALGALYEKSGNWFNALEKLQSEAQLLGGSREAVEIYHRIGHINETMLQDVANATIAYKAALDVDAGHVPSIQALKAIAQQKGDKQQYLHWLRQEAHYTQDEASRTEIHTTTGQFLQDDLGDLDAAAEEFERALAITYDHLPAVKPLAEIAYRDEKWQRAEQLLDILVERLDQSTEGAELCRQNYRLGYVCEKLAKEAKALKHYQRAFDVDATYLPALEGLGSALSRAGRFEDATKIYNAILIHHRDGLTDAEIVDYYYQLADLHSKLGQADRAQKNLENALKLDGSHAPSLRLLANVYLGLSEWEDAYEALMRLAPLHYGEDRTNVLKEIGRLAQKELDDPYRAIDAFEDANRQKPGDKEILEALLALYRHVRQGPRAVEVLEELVRVEQDETVRVRLNQTLGEVYRDEIRNEARAVQYFNAALDLDPNFVKAFESIETLLSASGNWPLLEENYILMLKRIPDTRAGIKGVLWKNLGDLYRFRLKNLDGATAAYRVIARMQPNSAEIVEVLADLLAKNPATVDEAATTYQRLIQLNPEKIARVLHELVRIALAKKAFDRCYVYAQALKILGDLRPNEAEILQIYAKQAQTQAKRRMTEKLWDALLVHPQARGPIASIATILWQSCGSALAENPRDRKLDNKKMWERKDLDAPVVPYFITQLKYASGVLDLQGFQLWENLAAADNLQAMRFEQPTLFIGRASPMLKETQSRVLWFQIARQLVSLRRPFFLARTIGPQAFSTLLDVAIKMVEPRYPVRGNPADVAAFEKALGKFGQPLANALRPHVTELLKNKQALSTKPFLEALEHTAIRAGYVLTGDLELCMALLKQPDMVALAHGVKVKELLLFAVSEEHFELRQRLGTAIGS